MNQNQCGCCTTSTALGVNLASLLAPEGSYSCVFFFRESFCKPVQQLLRPWECLLVKICPVCPRNVDAVAPLLFVKCGAASTESREKLKLGWRWESACMWRFCMPHMHALSLRRRLCSGVYWDVFTLGCAWHVWRAHVYTVYVLCVCAAEWAEDKNKKKMSQGSHTCGRNKHVPLQMSLSPLGPDFTTSTIYFIYDLSSFLAFDSTGSVSYLRRMETSS